MAEYYIWEGQTYCGDGTGTAAAASAGEAGAAWNDINILLGTSPSAGVSSPSAGDTIYIRSKDASDVNITVTLSVASTLGWNTATDASPINWVLDNGDKWPGIDGELSIESTGAYTITFQYFNKFFAKTHKNWVVKLSTAWDSTYLTLVYPQECTISNFHFDFGLATDLRGCRISTTLGVLFDRCHFTSAGRSAALFAPAGSSVTTLISPTIELTSATETTAVFEATTYALFYVIGGEIYGVGATTGAAVAQTANSPIYISGLKYPSTMDLFEGTPTADRELLVSSYGTDGSGGGKVVAYWGEMSSRTDEYYPYLNATFPDSAATGWAWEVYPERANPGAPARITVSKFFSETAAAKTITANLLVGNNFAEIDRSNAVLAVSYVENSTGDVITLTSRDAPGTALTDASTANWSATTYGAYGFTKKKIELVTPTAIKQDTLVMATILIEQQSIDDTDRLVVDPSVQLT